MFFISVATEECNDIHLFTEYPAQVINWAGQLKSQPSEGRQEIFGAHCSRVALKMNENWSSLHTGDKAAIKEPSALSQKRNDRLGSLVMIVPSQVTLMKNESNGFVKLRIRENERGRTEYE